MGKVQGRIQGGGVGGSRHTPPRLGGGDGGRFFSKYQNICASSLFYNFPLLIGFRRQHFRNRTEKQQRCRAVDPHSFNADPDPVFFFNVDPDPDQGFLTHFSNKKIEEKNKQNFKGCFKVLY